MLARKWKKAKFFNYAAGEKLMFVLETQFHEYSFY